MGLLSRAARQAARAMPEHGPFRPMAASRVNLRDRFVYQDVEPTTDDAWAALVRRRRGDVKKLPLSNLIATQESVAPDFAEVAARNAGELPVIVKENGKYYIHDGHHRLIALQDRGMTEAEVKVLTSNWRPWWPWS